MEMCGEVQVQGGLTECPEGGSIPIEHEPCRDSVEVIQAAPPEIEDGGQATIDEPVKQPQRRFRPELTIQMNAKVDKLIRANFIREVQYPIFSCSKKEWATPNMCGL